MATLDQSLLSAMVAVSNNSKMTKELHETLIAKLNDEEKDELLLWINKLVKPNTK